MILFYEYKNTLNYKKHFEDSFGDKLADLNILNYFNERLIIVLSFSMILNRKNWPEIIVGKIR